MSILWQVAFLVLSVLLGVVIWWPLLLVVVDYWLAVLS